MADNMSLLNNLHTDARIYFIGIGGISMSGLAIMAKRLGFKVAGSDPHDNERVHKLINMGITVHSQHHPQWIEDFKADLVVYTAAIPYWNVELRRAHEMGIDCVDRSVFLGWLTRSYDKVINIAGTHGKTTTTAMWSEILIEAKRNPTVHLGAEFKGFGNSTVRAGKPGDLLVSEACDYKNSLLNFYSTTAVLLNIDKDHLDFFAGIDELIETFAKFAADLPKSGVLIFPLRDKYIEQFLKRTEELRFSEGKENIKLISFGIADDGLSPSSFAEANAKGELADFVATNIKYDNGYPSFDVYKKGIFYASYTLKVPGRHNVLNSLAAIAAADVNGANPESSVIALSKFTGTEGRFTIKGQYRNATVITDYAHHPTSTKITIEAARNLPHRKIHVVYQPLTFSRVKLLFDEYVDALKDCESLVFYEIFSDRESDSLGMSSRLICDAINSLGSKAYFAETFADIKEYLDKNVADGDIILFLGPEQIRSFADKLLS